MDKAINGILNRSEFLEVLQVYVEGDHETPRTEKMGQLISIFDTFDRDRNGGVDIEEFTSGMRILVNGTEDEIIDFVFSGLDFNHDGGVSVEEFIAYFRNYFKAKCTVEGRKLETSRWAAIEDHLKRVFKGNDTDRSGAIDISEFRQAVKTDPDHPFTLVWQSFARPPTPQHPGSKSPSARRLSQGQVKFGH
jgi:hypothetical protein